MSARTGANIGIDAEHARAICDEIGDRLRESFGREMSGLLPARLQALVDRLAATDQGPAPSIVPSLDDMAMTERPIASH